jgi:hypothetical protein
MKLAILLHLVLRSILVETYFQSCLSIWSGASLIKPRYFTLFVFTFYRFSYPNFLYFSSSYIFPRLHLIFNKYFSIFIRSVLILSFVALSYIITSLFSFSSQYNLLKRSLLLLLREIGDISLHESVLTTNENWNRNLARNLNL